MRAFVAVITTLTLLSGISIAIGASQHHESGGVPPYAGQQVREVSSLSPADIDDLKAGRGWGLAKPAELNGFPGPRHILDLAEDLALNAQQKRLISKIYDRMNRRARQLGPQLIAAEKALDDAFRSGVIDRARLRALIAAAESARGELRIVHLDAHLEAAPLVSQHQRYLYKQLRGYSHAGSDGNHDTHRH